MSLIVTGADGMLGRAVVTVCRQQDLSHLALDHQALDVTLERHLAKLRIPGDVVINCAGARPETDPVQLVRTNALAPHMLARRAASRGLRVIHISTDCVFSGWDHRSPLKRSVREQPNPDTLYGRSKLAGEVQAPHVCNVRTSFVGPQHGLWRWVSGLPEGAVVEGYRLVWWSGSTVEAVAEALVKLAQRTVWSNVEHLATETPITKWEAVNVIAEHLGRTDLTILPVPRKLDRSLAPTVTLPSLQASLHELRPKEIPWR